MDAKLADEHLAFEKWLGETYHSCAEWDARRNCYVEFPTHMAWKGWSAAALREAPAEPVAWLITNEKRTYTCGLFEKKPDMGGFHESWQLLPLYTRPSPVEGIRAGLRMAIEECRNHSYAGYAQGALEKLIALSDAALLERAQEDQRGSAAGLSTAPSQEDVAERSGQQSDSNPIPSTDENWDNRVLGADERYVQVADSYHQRAGTQEPNPLSEQDKERVRFHLLAEESMTPGLSALRKLLL